MRRWFCALLLHARCVDTAEQSLLNNWSPVMEGHLCRLHMLTRCVMVGLSQGCLMSALHQGLRLTSRARWNMWPPAPCQLHNATRPASCTYDRSCIHAAHCPACLHSVPNHYLTTQTVKPSSPQQPSAAATCLQRSSRHKGYRHGRHSCSVVMAQGVDNDFQRICLPATPLAVCSGVEALPST